MTFDRFFPIDPALEREGDHVWLRALEPHLGRKGATPVLPPELDGKWDFDFEARDYATHVCASLGVSAAFKTSASVNSTTVVWNALVGKNAVLDSPAADSAIYETFWGVGLRVALTFASTDIKTKTDIAFVAASADFRGSDVQYEIRAVGLGPKQMALVLKTLPPLGRFDLDTYSAIEQVRSALKDALMKSLPKSGPASQVLRPLRVALSANPFHEVVQDAAAYRFVMMCLSNKLDLATVRELRSKPEWRALNAVRVDTIYSDVAKSTGTPSPEAVQLAQAWLNATA